MRRIPGKLQDARGKPVMLAEAVKLRAHMRKSSKTGVRHIVEEKYFVKVIVSTNSTTMSNGPQFVLFRDWIDQGASSVNAYWPPSSVSFPDPVARSDPGYDVELEGPHTSTLRTLMNAVPPETTHGDVILTLGDIIVYDPKVGEYNAGMLRLFGKTGRQYETYRRLLRARDKRIRRRLVRDLRSKVQERLGKK